MWPDFELLTCYYVIFVLCNTWVPCRFYRAHFFPFTDFLNIRVSEVLWEKIRFEIDGNYFTGYVDGTFFSMLFIVYPDTRESEVKYPDLQKPVYER
jgi:hypothetical protein